MKQRKFILAFLLIILSAALIPDVSSKPKKLRALRGHWGGIRKVQFSSDSKILASGDSCSMKLWNVADGEYIDTMRPTGWDFIFYDGDKKMVSSGCKNIIHYWDITTGKKIRSCQKHKTKTFYLAKAPDNSRLVSTSYNDGIKIYKFGSCSVKKSIKTKRQHWQVAFSPDSRIFATESLDNLVHLWDARKGKKIRTIGTRKPHTQIHKILFSHNGTEIITSSIDSHIKFWDVKSGTLKRTLKGHRKSARDLALSTSGRYLISGSWDNTVKIWDLSSGRCIKTIPGRSNEVSSVAISPDGKYIAWGGYMHVVYLMDVSSMNLK